MVASWEGESCDPLNLVKLKATALAYRVIADADFEGIEEVYANPAD